MANVFVLPKVSKTPNSGFICEAYNIVNFTTPKHHMKKMNICTSEEYAPVDNATCFVHKVVGEKSVNKVVRRRK